MTCDGCNKKALYFVEGKPHCQEHMLEALCSVPVAVIDIEALEYAQMKQKEVANIGNIAKIPA
jgi:uncharacterized protein CbrC (UPF0167 family)